MVRNAGIGVAMANGVKETLSVASAVVAGHDDGGVAEAFERYIFST
jgi:hydroxymethylpyrimidine pyrophosphatase-like HAD family hydrolase